jgi:hypothetical protein
MSESVLLSEPTKVISHLPVVLHKPKVVQTTLTIPFPQKQVSVGEAVAKLLKMVEFRFEEIARIGYESTKEIAAAAKINENSDTLTLDVQFQNMQEDAVKKLVQGSSRMGYITKGGKSFDSFDDVITLISSFKKLIGLRKMLNGDYLYLFELPGGYTAYTSEVRIASLFRKGLKKNIRFEMSEIPGARPGHNIQKIFYTPAKGPFSIPLQETRLVSFVVSEEIGLQLWQPGQYIGSLKHNELEDWVYISLFDE